MRPSVWFIVPAHGRVPLARVCLRQLGRTCDTLADDGIDASAVVIAADANLDTARDLGFGTVERENVPLGRKWNDGYELAGRTGIDYVIPFGSDDWIDAALVAARVRVGADIACSRLSAVVNEQGTRLATLNIRYGDGVDFGDGVRTIKTGLLRFCGYRPAQEDSQRGIDTSVWKAITAACRPQVAFVELHPLQIVDFKSRDEQLNPYDGFIADRRMGVTESVTPWDDLAAVYPAVALDEMRAVYRLPVEVAA